jgi:hypothetical protein
MSLYELSRLPHHKDKKNMNSSSHEARYGEWMLDDLSRSLSVTINAPQQFSILNTKIRTTSTVIHIAKYEDLKLDHLSLSLSATIGAPQQFSILKTKTRTTSTVIHIAKYENWQLDHLFRRSLSVTIGVPQQPLNIKTRSRSQIMGTGSLTTSSGGASP